MLKRNWIEDLTGWEGFYYLRLKGVPMKRSKDIGVIDFDSEKLARLVALEILKCQIPIKGRELKLLRSVVRLSLNRFAYRLGLTYGAIFSWEKAIKQRLSPINEIAVRLLCAEELGVEMSGRYSDLIGDARHSEIEVIVTSKKPTSKKFEIREISKPSYRGHRKVTVRAE